MRESSVLKDIITRLSNTRTRLFRMQSGNYELADGRHIVVGVPGMSDLIGCQSVLVTPEMVGKRIALFVAIEVKSLTGRVHPNQLDFVHIVKMLGGRAGIARCVEDARAIIEGTEAPTAERG